MGCHDIIHTGYGHDALEATPPPSWGKPVTEKTLDELWDGIQYMWCHPGFGGIQKIGNDVFKKCCEECGVQYRGTSQQMYCLGCRESVRVRQNRAAAKVRAKRQQERKRR